MWLLLFLCHSFHFILSSSGNNYPKIRLVAFNASQIHLSLLCIYLFFVSFSFFLGMKQCQDELLLLYVDSNMIRLGFNGPCRGNGADESINNHQTQPLRKND